MTTPFTIEQFFGVFAAYNAAIWPSQIGAYALGLVAVALGWLQRPLASRWVLAILALMWLWIGIGYHYLYFSSINPAATLFAGFFALQALLFAGSAVGAHSFEFRIERDFRTKAGFAFIAYAMVIYPALGLAAGHGFMAGPMFGVAPCPTTIFTIGMLMLTRGKWVAWLSAIPLFWSIVGLAAALQLGIREDLGLPVAAVVLALVLYVDLAHASRVGRLPPP